ncbi:MAG: hypothetical protein IJN17_09190 [Clostridia bacterium]|nr:hypothetical protein [Clostridia bacterium]
MAETKKKIEDDIAKIDKNLEVKTTLELDDVVFYDVKKAPFDLYGLYLGELDVFKRMPESVANSVSTGVASLNFNTAGGRVRFSTDSDYIAIKCVLPMVRNFSHMPRTGSTGFDLYEVEDGTCTYVKTFVPPKDVTDGYESLARLPDKRMRSFEINFPLYNRVDELYIGLREGSRIDHGDRYKYDKPVLYYGSSITQGGCASKPSNSYQSIISHDLDCDHINLGFSGSAKGEKEIVDYLASLDASVFVCDYDYNAPNAEHLKATHLPLYLAYREKNPDTPIIFVSGVKVIYRNEDLIKRRKIVFDTYMYAKEHGDDLVSFIDGHAIFGGRYGNVYTVDDAHPNDAGFLRMADVIGREVEIMLKRTAKKDT